MSPGGCGSLLLSTLLAAGLLQLSSSNTQDSPGLRSAACPLEEPVSLLQVGQGDLHTRQSLGQAAVARIPLQQIPYDSPRVAGKEELDADGVINADGVVSVPLQGVTPTLPHGYHEHMDPVNTPIATALGALALCLFFCMICVCAQPRAAKLSAGESCEVASPRSEDSHSSYSSSCTPPSTAGHSPREEHAHQHEHHHHHAHHHQHPSSASETPAAAEAAFETGSSEKAVVALNGKEKTGNSEVAFETGSTDKVVVALSGKEQTGNSEADSKTGSPEEAVAASSGPASATASQRRLLPPSSSEAAPVVAGVLSSSEVVVALQSSEETASKQQMSTAGTTPKSADAPKERSQMQKKLSERRKEVDAQVPSDN